MIVGVVYFIRYVRYTNMSFIYLGEEIYEQNYKRNIRRK